MTSPLKNFDTSPFLHKKYMSQLKNNLKKSLSNRNILSSLHDVLNVKAKKVELKTVLKGLDAIEILEWAHLKKLRAFKFYALKNFEKSFEILSEILSGLEEVNENEEEVFKRISNEIKVPCILKIVSCLTEKGKYQEAIKICDHILGNDETNKEAIHKKNVCLKLLNRKRNSDLDNIKKNQLALEMNQDDTTISDCSSSESNNINEDEKKKTKVLYYNDEMEELEKYGVLKYFAYPLKKVYSFTKNTLGCCKRNEATNPNSDDDRPHNEEEEDAESQEDGF